MYLHGETELELSPQGTLAEGCRAEGTRISALYTPAAIGTVVRPGELPLKHKTAGTVASYGAPGDVNVFDGKSYVMSEAIKEYYAFVKAWRSDKLGNVMLRSAAHNADGVMTRNARVTIVEAEEIKGPGDIDPIAVKVPGIHVGNAIQGTEPKKN